MLAGELKQPCSRCYGGQNLTHGDFRLTIDDIGQARPDPGQCLFVGCNGSLPVLKQADRSTHPVACIEHAVALESWHLLEHLAKAALRTAGSLSDRTHAVELADHDVHGDLQTCEDRQL